MYRTFIVEDNAIFRHAIRTIIDWEQQGFILTGEAVNGKQALDRMDGQAIDLLVTDITMPEMNGIELIQAIKARSPRTQVIVLSSYDDFQFVKEALKLGAMDYLLKHDLEEETLLKALSAARERIAKERINAGPAESSVSSRLLIEAILGQLEPAEIEQRAEEGHRTFLRAPLSVLSMRLPSDPPPEAVQRKLQDIAGRLQLECAIVYPAPYRAAAIVSFGKERSETRLAAMAHHAAGRFAAELGRSDSPTAVGLSPIGWGMKELPLLYAQADRALFSRIYREGDKSAVCVCTPCLHKTKSPAPSLTELLHEVCMAIRSASPEGILLHTERWLAELKKQQPDEAALKRMWMDLFAFLVVTASEKQVTMEGMDHWHRTIHERLTQLEPVEELHRLFVSRCMRILPACEAAPSDRREIQLSIAFIESHLHEEFTVTDIARVLNLSPNYLSNLFKQQTGKRIVEHVQERRIAAAKKLLDNTQLRVYEIAEKVGFKDASYFCKVFKEISGMTVSEYKKGP